MKTLRPYWVRHPYQLDVVIRLFAILLLVAMPFIFLKHALSEFWPDFKNAVRFLWVVIRHGEKAV